VAVGSIETYVNVTGLFLAAYFVLPVAAMFMQFYLAPINCIGGGSKLHFALFSECTHARSLLSLLSLKFITGFRSCADDCDT
jgi:hypothetical protein